MSLLIRSQISDQQLPFFNEVLNVEPLASIDDTNSIIMNIHVLFGFEADFLATGGLSPILLGINYDMLSITLWQSP